MKLETLGWNAWFQARVAGPDSTGRRPARVLTVDRDSCVIQGEGPPLRAEPSGKLVFQARSPMDLPAVGDWVEARCFDEDRFAVIHGILPRKSVLKRKTAGKKIEHQLIAANVDTAFIVQSLDGNFNLRRLERYLVMTRDGGIEPVLLLTKSDLLPLAGIGEKVRQVRSTSPDLPVQVISNKTGAGLKELHEMLRPAGTYCLLGSSGVGKTTIINGLAGEEAFATRSVREKDGRGRHTTSRRQLIFLKNDAMVIDTPGMRELGNIGVESGLDHVFDDIGALAGACRYRDCSHTGENGCAVLAAVEAGTLEESRYHNFLRISRESTYHEMSYYEKRQRDKAFGKMVKSVMKDRRKGPQAS